MTGATRMARLRAKRAQQGLTEIRGLWAPQDQHEAIKAAVHAAIKGPKMTAKANSFPKHVLDLLAQPAGHPVQIISGEGDEGTAELFTGKRTELAIRRRLNAERGSGDRWARAIVYSHSTEHGQVGIEVESGEYQTWHDPK